MIFARDPKIMMVNDPLYIRGFAIFEVAEHDPVTGKEYKIYRRDFALRDDASVIDIRIAAVRAMRDICNLYLADRNMKGS